MTEREQKALLIAATMKLVRLLKDGSTWIVPSQSSKGKYRVDIDVPNCTCPDYEARREKCKHIMAVEYTMQREQGIVENDESTEVIDIAQATKRRTYKQDWPAYNKAQTHEKDLFQQLLHELCSGIVQPEHKKGRRPLLYRDMLFSSVFKVYSTMSCRRFMSDLREVQAKGYVSKLMHFNSIFKYLELQCMTPLLHDLITYSSLPLKTIEHDFAIDSSGFSTCQYVRWFDTKYGKEIDVHDWIKVHLMTGVKTHIVTVAKVTGRHANDSPLLPSMVEETANNFTIKEVSADKAYSGIDNHEAIAAVGATPYM